MLKNEIEIPEGVEARLEGERLFVKGKKGEMDRVLKHPHAKIKIEDGKVIVFSELERKKFKAIMGTWKALVNNMITGVTRGWEGELKLVYSHFPVKLKVEESRLLIENFLGQRAPKEVIIPEDLKVRLDKNTIYVSGNDKEMVGQLCARIEQISKVKGRDKRVFQDGIYITKKPYPAGEENG